MRKLTVDLNALASNLAVLRKLVNQKSKVKVLGLVESVLTCTCV